MNIVHELNKRKWTSGHQRIVDHPELLKPHLKSILTSVDRPGQTAAFKRLVMKVLSLIDIPGHMVGLAFDKSFKLYSDKSEPIAVKVFAMTVMTNIAMREPDLKHEVLVAIEEQFAYGSPAFRSRAKKLLKKLKGV